MNNESSWKQKRECDFYEDQRAILREQAKAYAREKVKIDAMECRIAIKDAEAERKKSVCDEVQLLTSGEMQIISKNLLVDAKPRHFTNMRSPHLVILRRMEDETDEIVLFKCSIENRDIEICIDTNRLGNGTYLVRKLAAKGIYFELPTVKAKQVAVRIFGILLNDKTGTEWLPDNSGWVKYENGNFSFIEEGEMTWKKAEKLAK